MFRLPRYKEPDFTLLKNTQETVFLPAPEDGVAPENFHAMSIYPEYFLINGTWMLAKESRMDCVAVLTDGNEIAVREFRTLQKGERVAVGRSEDGSEGIFVYTDGFASAEGMNETFAFRQGRSRETAFSKDYDDLYELLKHEKEQGKIVWVMGPACAFDADSRNAFSKLVANGYVQALLAGNALATHDLEAAMLGTALGQNVYTQQIQPNGHYNHLDLINRARRCGSIEKLIAQYELQDGIVEACKRHGVPMVLAGSIRDDGPLPSVYANVYEAQNAMRDQIRDATTVITLATTLHSIAVGNMTPSYRFINGAVRPVYFYCVDISEFTLRKLHDRGSLTSRTFVANVQDFVVNLARSLC